MAHEDSDPDEGTIAGENYPVTVATPQSTPGQAKSDAISALTLKAYDRASTLELTKDERVALLAPFPDDAFHSGANGKDEYIYIQHADLRNRLNDVFGPGQWAVIPRNRWTENFTTAKNEEGVRVYVEAMLLIRGVFVGEAIGDMDYFPKNRQTNRGDAIEGAKSAALRRCIKELGVGMQPFDKDFVKGWKERKKQARRRAVPGESAVLAAGGSDSEAPLQEAPASPAAGQVEAGQTLQQGLASEQEKNRPTVADDREEAYRALISARDAVFNLVGLPNEPQFKQARAELNNKWLAKRKARATSDLTLDQIGEFTGSLETYKDALVATKLSKESCVHPQPPAVPSGGKTPATEIPF